MKPVVYRHRGLGSAPIEHGRSSALAVVFALLIVGCYHYRVMPARSLPADDGHSATLHSLFWGLVQTEARQPECQGNGAAEVVASTNLGYTLLSVVTLGIWSPLELTWKCAKDRVQAESGLD